MRGSPARTKVLRPLTAEQAVRWLAREPGAMPLAGGTDFMVAWNAGLLNGKTVLDLSGISAWRAARATKTSLRVGALVTHTMLQSHPEVRRRWPLLARACAVIGARAIQNRGTLGGNIANASPAGDTFPVLAVHQARVHVVSAGGARVIPFLEVFRGVKKTSLAAGELIEAVEIPAAPAPARQYFRKVGARAAQALSKTVAAGLLWLERDGRVRELRFALGSMAPTVRRLKAVEEFARGKTLTPDVVERACALVAADVSPIDDVRSSAEYRLAVSQNMLREFLSRPPRGGP